jgi:hypothetical protein
MLNSLTRFYPDEAFANLYVSLDTQTSWAQAFLFSKARAK